MFEACINLTASLQELFSDFTIPSHSGSAAEKPTFTESFAPRQGLKHKVGSVNLQSTARAQSTTFSSNVLQAVSAEKKNKLARLYRCLVCAILP
jgi:hypothetical protein